MFDNFSYEDLKKLFKEQGNNEIKRNHQLYKFAASQRTAFKKNKILPVEYKDMVLEFPLLANKQFYYMHEISNSDFLGAQLKQKIQKAIVAAAPIERLILEAYKD